MQNRGETMNIRIRCVLAIVTLVACVPLGCRRLSGGPSDPRESSQGNRGVEPDSLQETLTQATVTGGRLAQLRFESISVPADNAAKAGIESSDEVAVLTRSSEWRDLSKAQIKVLAAPPAKKQRERTMGVWGSNAYVLKMSDGRLWYISCDSVDGVLIASLVPILGDSYLVRKQEDDWMALTWTGLGDVLSQSWEQPDDAK
jgi:hypothetical protein